ncbi:MAG: hypothetical protein EOR68_24145 [Mesorhizobium sp.]|uniref:hypothetical protein n=1 Tax=Mesorhizobium sp. TaxID=1871066 RepID=UPI000FE760EB|nr:hypothetical protein [Mesorhizobium sp.]RWL86860.1 MAG: hypothetical protein EOR69_03615 [Mesorhizobium sp.]RWL89482.1 MAG: hypothetical protein EOR67_08655 [Mesorhizobium sp.]RWL93538.1 MAG: hypothetical protein EOR68_24145 [Mesorhizobium sp.]RWM01510.1 MAG: hypothetical protein EOR70_06965 [Mesorhizobium sp.]TIP49867.1 MAG: hypothetical protein E5X77_08975 [Mesorhizobium sp.]
MKAWREYVMDVAGKMDVSIDAEKISNDLYEVQRDALSMEWRKRFELENKSRSLENYTHMAIHTQEPLETFSGFF